MKKGSLLISLFLLAFSGLMLHYRAHPFLVTDKLHPYIVTFDGTKFLGALLPMIDVVVVTALFLSKRTAVYGYLLNGLIVIYGTVFMAHFSIAEVTAKSLPLQNLIFKSTFPDIAIAWADFFVGKALYDFYMNGEK